MRHDDELVELRTQRMALLRELRNSSSAKRQLLNKRLAHVSKRIQRLSKPEVTVSYRDDGFDD